jgi:hypothetical protein
VKGGLPGYALGYRRVADRRGSGGEGPPGVWVYPGLLAGSRLHRLGWRKVSRGTPVAKAKGVQCYPVADRIAWDYETVSRGTPVAGKRKVPSVSKVVDRIDRWQAKSVPWHSISGGERCPVLLGSRPCLSGWLDGVVAWAPARVAASTLDPKLVYGWRKEVFPGFGSTPGCNCLVAGQLVRVVKRSFLRRARPPGCYLVTDRPCSGDETPRRGSPRVEGSLVDQVSLGGRRSLWLPGSKGTRVDRAHWRAAQ